jgi:transposase
VAHALSVTLVLSRHQYVHVTHSQQIEDLIDGLEDAQAFFGGVTRRVMIDYVARHIIDLMCRISLCGRGRTLAGGA